MDRKEAMRKKRAYDKEYEFRKKQKEKQEILKRQNSLYNTSVNNPTSKQNQHNKANTSNKPRNNNIDNSKKTSNTPNVVDNTSFQGMINLSEPLGLGLQNSNNNIKKINTNKPSRPQNKTKDKSKSPQKETIKKTARPKDIDTNPPSGKRRKYKKNYTIYYVLLSIVFVITLFVLSRNVFFKVNNINILQVDENGEILSVSNYKFDSANNNTSSNSISSSTSIISSSKTESSSSNTSSIEDDSSSSKTNSGGDNSSSSNTSSIEDDSSSSKTSSGGDNSSSSNISSSKTDSSKTNTNSSNTQNNQDITPKKFDDSKIRLDSGILSGDDILKINLADKSKSILDKNINLDKVTVNYKLPSTIEIRVVVGKPTTIIKQDKKYYNISQNNRILSITSKKETDGVLLSGIKLDNHKSGDFVDFSENEQYEQYNNIITIAKEMKFIKINEIKLEDLFDIRLITKNFEIILGNYTDIEYKMNFARKIIKEEIGPTEKGTIDVSVKGKCNFIPKK